MALILTNMEGYIIGMALLLTNVTPVDRIAETRGLT